MFGGEAFLSGLPDNRVTVTGRLEFHKGHLEIVITSLIQIEKEAE